MFTVNMGVGNPDGGELIAVTAVVDTGADHSMMPQSLLAQLGIARSQELTFVMDDGRKVKYGYGLARFRIDDVEWPCPVVFGPDNAYLLGVSALEIFNLDADPSSGRLLPVDGLSLGQGGRMENNAPQIRPTAVAPLAGHRIWLRYSDGVTGEIDLSHLVGSGVFSAWNDRAFLSRCGSATTAASPGETASTFARTRSICKLAANR